MAPAGVPLRGPHDPGERVGRFHTARAPMGLSGWLHYPAAWLRTKTAGVPERPWIVPAAIGWLRRRIRSDWSILELGSGRSTVWFARRAGRVISFEDNEYWYERTTERLEQTGISDVDLRLRSVEELPSDVRALPDDGFDLVVVDFLESPQVTRVDCLKTAMRKVRSGRYLLLDDSDRPGYAESFELLADWRCRRFAGIKDEWPEACETAIFRRPIGRPARAHGEPEQERPRNRNRGGPLRGLLLSEPVSRILSWAAIHLGGLPGPRRAGS